MTWLLSYTRGSSSGLALVQGENRSKVELSEVKDLVAPLTDAAADLAKVLAAGGVYKA